MAKNDKRIQEIKDKAATFFNFLDDEYMTRSIYEWNCQFMSEIYRLNEWRSEDGMMYSPEKVAEEIGFTDDVRKFWHFKSCVRRQIISYKEKTALELHEAGKTNAEIAADLTVGDYEMTEKSVERMLERLLG